MQRLWIDFDKLEGFFRKCRIVERFTESLGSFLNLWTMFNFCKAQVCERCMDRAFIIITLLER
jgi:hypothetical protein